MVQKGEQLKPEKEKVPEKAEKEKTGIETENDLRNLGERRVKDVEKNASEVTGGGNKAIERATTAAGGKPADIEQGKNLVHPVQKEIQNLAARTQEGIKNVAEIGKESLEKQKETGLKDNYTRDQLDKLREQKKENYGDSLVKKYHKEARTLEEHESAQWKSYEELDKKIDDGVVKPDSIHSDVIQRLELRNNTEPQIKNREEIAGHITSELKDLTKKGFIKEEEAALIKTEAGKFAEIYAEAFPEASPQQIFELARDNARKLAYQTERDKQVFSGSDHGTKHILEGNMKMADKMIESLDNKVSAKDKVLIHQIIVDHDLGYTTGIAQAKESFEASKDHPLFSAKFVEANQDYYKQMFGKDGYEMIRDGILQHSYVKSEYNTVTDSKKGFNPDIIRSVTSTVDALGVTAETKCPAFFREPEAVKVLQKVQLYAMTHEGKVAPEALADYKDQLRSVANKEADVPRREGFLKAIDSQFNLVTVEMTLGTHVGVLKDIQMTKEREGKVVPVINMDISRVQALLGDMFGDKIATNAFVKAMEDFGVSKVEMADMAEIIRQIKEAKSEKEKNNLKEKLTYSSDKAIFKFNPELADTTPEIGKTFDDLGKISIRGEINNFVRKLEKNKEKRTPADTDNFLSELTSAVSEKTDADDLLTILAIQERIAKASNDPNKLTKAVGELKSFITKSEREFLGVQS